MHSMSSCPISNTHITRIELYGKAEVSQNNTPPEMGVWHKNIFCFYVSVRDVIGMKELHGRRNLTSNESSIVIS